MICYFAPKEAANFYVSILKKSKIADVLRHGEAEAEASRRPKGPVMTVTFQLNSHPEPRRP